MVTTPHDADDALGCHGLQIQAELGEGHINIIEAKEVVLTDTHLCLIMECAAGKVLTGGAAARHSSGSTALAPRHLAAVSRLGAATPLFVTAAPGRCGVGRVSLMTATCARRGLDEGPVVPARPIPMNAPKRSIDFVSLVWSHQSYYTQDLYGCGFPLSGMGSFAWSCGLTH